jgi:hypothetical protein
VQQGATLVSGLSADVNVATTVSLPVAEWIPESGTAPPPADPLYGTAHVLHPRVVVASVVCSKQLLVQSPQAEAIVVEDLSKAISNAIDRAVLYGDPAANPLQPAGIFGTAGTHKVPLTLIDFWSGITELSYLCQVADLDLATFGWILSPLFNRNFVREQISHILPDELSSLLLPRPLVSNSVRDQNEAFAGCWSAITIGLYAVEIIIDPYSLVDRGQVRITAATYVDFAIRYPQALGYLG